MHSRFSKIIDQIIEWGIIFLLFFTPLAFGAVHLWAYSLMELVICLLCMLWILKLIAIRNERTSSRITSAPTSHHTPSRVNRFGFVKTPLNIPVLVFVGLIFFQLIPLPPGVLKFLNPHTYSLYETTLTGWPEEAPFFESADDTPEYQNTEILPGESPQYKKQNPYSSWRTLSINPYATKTELLKVLAYIGIFLLIINNPGLRITRIIIVAVGIGFFISFLGILQKLTGTTKIYWIRDASYATPFGSYICRNHFAGYIGMVIPLTLGLLVARFARITFSQKVTWRTFVETLESHFLGNIILIFALMIMISALCLSLSRGGIISFLTTVVIFFALISFKRTRAVIHKGRGVLLSVLLVTLIFLLWFGLSPVLDRMSDLSSSSRIVVYQDTITMAKDFPFWGTGWGTFQYLYPKYKSLEDRYFYKYAHNDYLELLSDNGLSGFLAVLSFIVIFFWKVLAKWWKRRDSYARGITLGGVCSIVSILFHSYGDFNLHIPANALFLSCVLGITYNAVTIKK
ncbi:MAG: O-antigen ligase family protein [wastewater metagenome]|nr:O-antigen ligase family protein [Candidatus Loosdrechtia aerotolerans]